MSDFATIGQNDAFRSPTSDGLSAHASPSRSQSQNYLSVMRSSTPTSNDPRSSSPRSQPLSGEPRRGGAHFADKARRKLSTSSSSSASSSTSSSPRHAGKSSRSSPPPPPPMPPLRTSSHGAPGVRDGFGDGDEEQWLLHSSRVARAYSDQLSHPPSPHYPKLIEQTLIVDDARGDDDDAPEPAPLPPPSPRPLPFDLLSSYEQAQFIRYPPSLLSMTVTRWLFAGVGLMEGGCLGKGESGAAVESGWEWAVWLWQALWTAAYVGGLCWRVWVELTEDARELTVNRAVCAVCALLSLGSALFIAHHTLANRLLPTRVYYAVRNSRDSPAKAASSVDRALYLSLAAFVLLSAVGLYADVQRLPASIVLRLPSPASVTMEGRTALFVGLVVVLRLHFTVGLSLLMSLLSVHALRVEQASTEVRSTLCDEEAMAAQVVDVDLALRDASERLGWKVAVLLAALLMDAAVRWVELAWREPTAAARRTPLVGALCDCAAVLWVGWATARLNRSCSLLQSAVASFSLLRSAYPRPFACPELGFEILGIRLTYLGMLCTTLSMAVALLWVAQTRAIVVQ